MPGMNPCPILIVNLPSSQDRRRAMEEEIKQQGIEAEFVDAVDGRAMTHAELAAVCGPRGDGYFRGLLPGEVGCYQSHLAAANRIVEAGWTMAVVLEDDVRLPSDFAARLEALVQGAEPRFDLIKLAGVVEAPTILQRLSNGDTLVRSRRPPYGAYAHLWTRAGATKLLRHGRPLRRPFDVQIKHWWELELEWAVVRPDLVGVNRELNSVSTIAASRRRSGDGWLGAWRYKLGYAVASRWHRFRQRP